MNYMDPDNWRIDSSQTIDEATLEEIREYLNRKGYLVGLHSHFCGARCATPIAFYDPDMLDEYLSEHGRPGDIFRFWPLPDDSPVFEGKFPNENGEVPTKGAY